MDVVSTRKESIILTTIDVMNEYGVQALSTREVARREGVSEGAIFKHFTKKNDLIIAVLDTYSKQDKVIHDSALSSELEAKEAISLLFESLALYYERYPAITSITQALEELQYNIELNDKIKAIINARRECLVTLIEKGQMKHQIKADADKNALADILVGTFNGLCLKWRMNNYDFSLKEDSHNAIQIILNAFDQLK